VVLQAHDKFGRLTELPARDLYALCKPHLGPLLCYVVDAAPLAVTPRSLSECLQALKTPPATAGDCGFTFDRVDIPREPALRAKHMTILKYARVRAEVIAMTAMKSKDTRRRKAYELRRQAADALSSNPRHELMRALKQQLDVMIEQDVTLVHLAALKGDVKLLGELAELEGEEFQVLWDLEDAKHRTAALIAFEAKQDSCVDFLVGRGAKTPTEVSVSARASCSLFTLRALRHDHPFSPSSASFTFIIIIVIIIPSSSYYLLLCWRQTLYHNIGRTSINLNGFSGVWLHLPIVVRLLIAFVCCDDQAKIEAEHKVIIPCIVRRLQLQRMFSYPRAS
jgi:hypothetical protein